MARLISQTFRITEPLPQLRPGGGLGLALGVAAEAKADPDALARDRGQSLVKRHLTESN